MVSALIDSGDGVQRDMRKKWRSLQVGQDIYLDEVCRALTITLAE